MLFVTNRYSKFGFKSRPGCIFDFDHDCNDVSASLFFCSMEEKGKKVEIGATEFFNRLKRAEHKSILVFFHGFNTLPDSAMSIASRLQVILDGFHAETLVVPAIWPCDNDFGVIKDYYDDKETADASGFAFARMISKFQAWQKSSKNPCLKNVSILAHSMGNRVLRSAFQRFKKRNGGYVPFLFSNIFMVAADVKDDCLEYGKSGQFIAEATRGLYVYYNPKDMALGLSKAANGFSGRRLGHQGVKNRDAVAKNIYELNCMNIRSDDAKNHTYFLEHKGSPTGTAKSLAITIIETESI